MTEFMNANKTILSDSLIKSLRFVMPIYSLFIIWASLRTSTGGGWSIPHFDKVLHAGVYGLLALGVSLAWPHLSKIKIGLACLLYGGLMEIAQATLTAGRTPSFGDFIANGIGAAIALFFVLFISKKFAR